MRSSNEQSDPSNIHGGSAEISSGTPEYVAREYDDAEFPSSSNPVGVISITQHDERMSDARTQLDDAFKVVEEQTPDTVSAVVDTDAVITDAIADDTGKMPKLRTRPARFEDIPTLVDIDIKSFSQVYKDYEKSDEELRAELKEKFEGRFKKVGGDWMRLLEVDGEIAGFMTCCPTSKEPEDFESWEETTDNGTLETTYDPSGKNVYVVSLSMLPLGSKYEGQNMLFGNSIGRMIAEGYERAFFESRLPGLRTWVKKQCRLNDLNFEELTEDQKDAYAEEYFQLTTKINGKEVPYDRLIRIYDDVGCKFVKVASNAYDDVPSMNYGVVCVLDNLLPKKLQKSRTISKIAGNSLRLASKSHRIMQKIF